MDAALDRFAERHDLVGLSPPSLTAVAGGRAGYSVERARRFLAFQARIHGELLQHRVIVRNPYTAWFSRGEQSEAQIRAFIVQFSVFSNQFLLAQLHKMLNADTLEGMRSSKEILANEIGVVFRRLPQAGTNGANGAATAGAGSGLLRLEPDREIDPELVSTEGTVDGGRFQFRAAHFEWLLRMAERAGLGFDDVGKRRHGLPSTIFFCDELIRLYGGDDYTAAQASSYAVENWATAGFWKELIAGFTGYNRRSGAGLPLAFFTWHDQLEAQHARHTQEELEEIYFDRPLDEDSFIRCGNEMLAGVAAFWDGLEAQRSRL
jgi:hypothetical protein